MSGPCDTFFTKLSVLGGKGVTLVRSQRSRGLSILSLLNLTNSLSTQKFLALDHSKLGFDKPYLTFSADDTT